MGVEQGTQAHLARSSLRQKSHESSVPPRSLTDHEWSKVSATLAHAGATGRRDRIVDEAARPANDRAHCQFKTSSPLAYGPFRIDCHIKNMLSAGHHPASLPVGQSGTCLSGRDPQRRGLTRLLRRESPTHRHFAKNPRDHEWR